MKIMKNLNRDIMMLLRTEFMTEREIEQEVEQLNMLLHRAETPSNFCISHELVQRNDITCKKEKLLQVFHQPELKPFWFLINKN